MTDGSGAGRARANFYAGLTLAATMLIGGATGFAIGRSTVPSTRGPNVTLLGVSRAALLDSLELTPAQRTRIDGFLDEAEQHAKATVSALMSDVRAVTRETRMRVRAVLTEHQRAQFDSILNGVPEPRLRSPVAPGRGASKP